MEHTINLHAIFQVTIYVLAVFGLFYVLQTITHAVKDTKKDMHAKQLDTEREEKSRELDSDIIQELIKKFPDVSEEFMRKSEKLQNIENNQEIHDINKKIRRLEEKR